MRIPRLVVLAALHGFFGAITTQRQSTYGTAVDRDGDIYQLRKGN